MWSAELDECHHGSILPSAKVLEQNRIQVKAFFVINALYCVNTAKCPHTTGAAAL
jgi:hypothetical protein